MARRILIIDDDALFRRSLSFHLQQAGYQVLSAANAEDGLSLLSNNLPDLVLLDIGLPGMDGLDALHSINALSETPVIFITARHRELDEVLGLELGADDYITKPFDTNILLARIKAVMRRSHRQPQISSSEPFSIGDIDINSQAHSVTVSGLPVELTPIEFQLLNTLAQQAGHVFSANDLLATVWGEEYIGQPQVVYVHIRALRTKIEKNPNRPNRIVTVRGVGYKLISQGG